MSVRVRLRVRVRGGVRVRRRVWVRVRIRFRARFKVRVRIRVRVSVRVGVRVRVRVRERGVIKPIPHSRYPLARKDMLFGVQRKWKLTALEYKVRLWDRTKDRKSGKDEYM